MKYASLKKTNTVCFTYTVLSVIKILEIKRMVATRAQGEEIIESYCLMGIEFPFYKMKKVLEMNPGDGCITQK